MRRSAACLAILCSVAVGATAGAQTAQPSWYAGKIPVAGDDHQHPGSLTGNFLVHKRLSNEPLQCPHSIGDPLDFYAFDRLAGYDWVLLSHHTHTMTGDPHGTDHFGNYGAYTWWTDPRSQPLPRTPPPPPPQLPPYLAVPDENGLPDYTRPGQAVEIGWNEALSLSSAADAANDESGGFVAFSGREFTTVAAWATSSRRFEGGHKVVLLPGTTTRICGPQVGKQKQGPTNACDETDLYRWAHANGGVIIQAHPFDWSPGMTPWHPDPAPDPPQVDRRAGMSDVYVQGVEVAGYNAVEYWESSFQTALANGYRVFPSYGSDNHAVGTSLAGCRLHAPPNLTQGTAICWVPSGPPSRAAILDAMRARNCYYSRSHKAMLTFEARNRDSEAWQPMGSSIDREPGDPTSLRVRVAAVNDLANQALGRRFDRLEIVHAASRQNPAAIAYACDLPGRGEAHDCCTQGPSLADRCELPGAGADHVFSNPAPGAYYVRVCEAAPGQTCAQWCADDPRDGCANPRIRLVSAPVFLDGSAYKSAQQPPIQNGCDFDGDGLSCEVDSCWLVPKAAGEPDHPDQDGDGVGDACDICPAHADPDQVDSDGDGHGDACPVSADSDGDRIADATDLCDATYDAAQVDEDGDGIGNACDRCRLASNTAPGDCDTDRDGYGNACDADFNGDRSSDALDFEIWYRDFARSGLDSAGTGTDMNCDSSVDATDFDLFFEQFAGAGKPGPSGLACAGVEPPATCPN